MQVWSCTSVRVAQTKSNSEQKKYRKTARLPFKQWFSAEKKFYREHLSTFCKLKFQCREKKFDENHVRHGAHELRKRNFTHPKKCMQALWMTMLPNLRTMSVPLYPCNISLNPEWFAMMMWRCFSMPSSPHDKDLLPETRGVM